MISEKTSCALPTAAKLSSCCLGGRVSSSRLVLAPMADQGPRLGPIPGPELISGDSLTDPLAGAERGVRGGEGMLGQGLGSGGVGGVFVSCHVVRRERQIQKSFCLFNA